MSSIRSAGRKHLVDGVRLHHTHIDIYIKADNTNRREERKKKKKTKKAPTDLDQHCLVLFILIYPIQSSLNTCGGCSKMYYPIYMNWS